MTEIEHLIGMIKKAKSITVNYKEDDSNSYLNVRFERLDVSSDKFSVAFLNTIYSVPSTFVPFSKGDQVCVDDIIDWYFLDVYNTVENETIICDPC